MARRPTLSIGFGDFLLVAVILAQWVMPGTAFSSEGVKFLDQGFFFGWPLWSSLPVPATARCDTINLSWDRGGATGPNPVAPYSMTIYTSTFITPLVVDVGSASPFTFTVPFTPDSIYQVCMWDKNGVPGGCQAMYTVYPSPNVTLNLPNSCQNLTYPQPTQELGIDAQTNHGPLSQTDWVPQCSDIQIKPLNGTPPYTLTIAPASHPPYNISIPDQNPVNWTVRLGYATPFFISVIDDTNMAWSYGPLHSGANDDTSCLDTSSVGSKKSISAGVAAGSAIGALVVGLIAGALGVACFGYWRRRRQYDGPELVRKSSHGSVPSLSREPTMVGRHGHNSLIREGYRIEPFVPPGEQQHGDRPLTTVSESTTAGGASTTSGNGRVTMSYRPHHSPSSSKDSSMMRPSNPTTPAAHQTHFSDISPIREESRSGGNQVYVVHHDGGRAPVTVYTPDGAEVVELPPGYRALDAPADVPERDVKVRPVEDDEIPAELATGSGSGSGSASNAAPAPFTFGSGEEARSATPTRRIRQLPSPPPH